MVKGPKCQNVGDANPDVAGIGILLSFGLQALIAIIVSIYSCALTYMIRGEYPQILRSYMIWTRVAFPQNRVRAAKIHGAARLEELRKQKEITDDILLQSSDVQVVTGVTLLLSGLVQFHSLSFYHLHIIYDTVCFVAVSICAAVASSFNSTMQHKEARYVLIGIWCLLYLVYTSLLGCRLRSWDDSVRGHCYDSTNLARPQDPHPRVDHAYIALTCLYVFTSLQMAILASDDEDKGVMAEPVLLYSALQFPLHVYSIITLRVFNEKLIASGVTEQDWGFGQIGAMVLLGANMTVLLNGFLDYRKWKAERLHPQNPPVPRPPVADPPVAEV